MATPKRAFEKPSSPKETVVIDKRALWALMDTAHTIWMATKSPNANLILLESLRQYLVHQGAQPNFTVKLEEK
jgi:hypothetical protein